MRINKYLANKNYASRREADKLISEGKVFINKRVAVLGDLLKEGDVVEIKGLKENKSAYYAYYKPRGVVTFGAQYGDKEIKDIVKFPIKVYPLGRLDKDSEGLIFFSNDGRITKALLSPESKIEKEYEVKVDKNISNDFVLKMEKGINIGSVGNIKNYFTKKAIVKKKFKKIFNITITEGKNRQIRKMCGALGYNVLSLKRIRISNIKLKDLKPGKYRKIEGEELEILLKNINII